MTFAEKMKEIVEQGMAASKDFINVAGAKAQDLGEKGVLKFEIMQLEGQAQKLFARLGAEVYTAFVEKSSSSVSRDDEVVSSLISELAGIRDAIEKREAEMKKS